MSAFYSKRRQAIRPGLRGLQPLHTFHAHVLHIVLTKLQLYVLHTRTKMDTTSFTDSYVCVRSFCLTGDGLMYLDYIFDHRVIESLRNQISTKFICSM